MLSLQNNLKELPQAGVTSLIRSVGSAASVRGDIFNMENEVWVNVFETNGFYQISTSQRVRTTTNVNSVGKVMAGHPKIIKQHTNTNGYLFVNITINGKETPKPIHRLMAETFIPNPMKLPCINHINCDKKDNRIDNLEWCTIEYNTSHAHKNGRFPNPTGIKNASATITDEIAMDIFTSKLSAKELAEKYKIHFSRIYDVRAGVSWNHVTGLPLKNYRKPRKKYEGNY